MANKTMNTTAMTDSPANIDNEKKQQFLQYKNTKEAYTDRSKSMGRKVGLSQYSKILPEEGLYLKKTLITPLK